MLSGMNPDWSGLQKDVIHNFLLLEGKERQTITNFIQILKENNVDVEYMEIPDYSVETKIYEMTGSPKPHFKTKAEFTDFAKKHNLVHGKLNKDADYLITDSYSSTSSKMKKAEKLGVEVITYEDLLKKFI
jgi:NAD-dependent DNA ligase